MRWLLNQFLDLLAFWLLPFFCFLLPVRPANGVARFIARRGWFCRHHADNALANVSRLLPPDNPEEWKNTFRLIRFLDAVDTWHGHFSSDRRIARSLVTDPSSWPEVDKLVLLGTHLGPSTLLLRRVAAAGYRPRFVFRDIPADNRRSAPVFHAYLSWRVAYLRKVCRGGEIRVPGGRSDVAEALAESGTALVLLLDAPAEKPRGSTLTVRGAQLPVDPGGLGMAVNEGALASQFAMYWDETKGRRIIEVSDASPLEDRDQALESMEGYLNSLMDEHPAQWQLWLTANPVFNTGD